jgi:alkylated DNA repair dioxygenase AlkB
MQSSFFSATPQVFKLPDAEICYYEDFIDNQQATYERLLKQLKWSQDTIQMYGKPVLIPRMNAWYGDETASYSYSGLALSPLEWTQELVSLKVKLETFLAARFNSVLANHYRSGGDSVAWHSDDEKELGTKPLIASLSFGANRRFSLRHRLDKDKAAVHIDLVGGSLLVMSGDTQRYWQHQLAKTTKPVAGRINLTFRTIIN